MDFRDKKQQGMDHYDPFLAVFILPAAGGISGLFFVESGVAEVDVGGVHLLLAQADTFAKPLEVDDLPLPQEADYVVYIRVVGQPENVIVGEPCLLLWCDLVRTTFFVDGIGFLYVVCYYVDRSSNMSKLHLKGI